MIKLKCWICILALTGYLLGVSRGYVAVWKGEDSLPWLVTWMPVFLRLIVKKLEAGISIPDGYTLSQALEDFCS